MFKDTEEFIAAYKAEFVETTTRSFEDSSKLEKYNVLVSLISIEVSKIRTKTRKNYAEKQEKKVYYFSLEFLMGRLLENYLINLGVRDIVSDGLKELGEDLLEICKCEKDPGLGNGGLGRLASCFLDSMASLNIAGYGIGLRYRFGLFKQKIVDDAQTEEPDNWLSNGYPWEIIKPDRAVGVKFGGIVDRFYEGGKMSITHHGFQTVLAVPYDVPILGYGGETVNVLRLWKAELVKEAFDLLAFNKGEYSNALKERNEVEAITCILYPDDSNESGRILRLKQEYFLVSAGLTSILQEYKRENGTNLANFTKRVCVHINDTHPAVAVPELMRLLLDEEGLEWDEAWSITTKTISYTNHTVLPEALEKWSIDLFRQLLPRVYMIVEEIDRRYREAFDHSLENWQERLKSTAVLWDGQVRMANLAIIGSYSVNGVASLHTEILKKSVLKDFYLLEPSKFNNKTNGISHRRFLVGDNPDLSKLISETIGEEWIKKPQLLKNLLNFQNDEDFLNKLMRVKYYNKCRLATYIKETTGISVNPTSVFDVQVKRIHAYKRQLLNIFKVMALYNSLKENPNLDIEPHTFIFAGKAAQSYAFAKDIIRLVNVVSKIVNNDPVINDKIKVVFIEDFNVSKAQLIYPAADISEQISTAGKEASGTGNMKFMFNGAITLGTLDGANIEIKEALDNENLSIFGLTLDQIEEYYFGGGYIAYDICNNNPQLKKITDQLINGFFSAYGDDFWGIYDNLLRYNDEYFVLKDFDSYMEAWYGLNTIYKDKNQWAKMSLANIANAGYFTSDRTVAEYADEIWHMD